LPETWILFLHERTFSQFSSTSPKEAKSFPSRKEEPFPPPIRDLFPSSRVICLFWTEGRKRIPPHLLLPFHYILSLFPPSSQWRRAFVSSLRWGGALPLFFFFWLPRPWLSWATLSAGLALLFQENIATFSFLRRFRSFHGALRKTPTPPSDPGPTRVGSPPISMTADLRIPSPLSPLDFPLRRFPLCYCSLYCLSLPERRGHLLSLWRVPFPSQSRVPFFPYYLKPSFFLTSSGFLS